MTELIDVLYEYAEDHLVRGLLDQEKEYANVLYYAERQERMLRESMGEEDRQQLDDLLEERKLIAFFEGEALFRAGFQMALELTR